MKGSSAWWVATITIVLLIRFVSLSAYPLTDTTEARYGEIARVMATSGDWITPRLDPDVPFWAKPPLSFWQGALSVSILGTSEFAVRLPMFLNLLVVLIISYSFARYLTTHRTALISTFIVITSVVGFVTSGAVMTDPAMLLATTMAMVSFWYAIEKNNRRWGYCFFLALAIGFLAKGPIAWVLTGIPIIFWLTLHRKWACFLTRFPLLHGTGIVLVLVTPWFLLSEMRTPGFLNYFFVGEHYMRFVDSGWKGDLYGTAHDEPRGTIWLLTAAAFAPWSILVLIIGSINLAKYRTRVVSGTLSPAQHYLLLWCLWPSIFFTFAGNILPTYVLPALPAFAILLAMSISKSKHALLLTIPGLLLPIIVVLASPLGVVERLEKRTQRGLVQYAQKTYPDVPLAYVARAPHSARFYSLGTAHFLPDIDAAIAWSKHHSAVLLVVRQNSELPPSLNTDSVDYLGRWNKNDLYLVGS